jgi:hypothetical protein
MLAINDTLTVPQLRLGCVFGTIAHAVFCLSNPELEPGQSWENSNYNVQDFAGRLGTITFLDGALVAALFDGHSRRTRDDSTNFIEIALAEAPAAIKTVAKTVTFQYMLQSEGGVVEPRVTALFWSEDGERLTAPEPWTEVYANGGELLRRQFLGVPAGAQAWFDEYSLNLRESTQVSGLFEAWKSGRIQLQLPAEAENYADAYSKPSANGVNAYRRTLEGIGFRF